MVALLRLCMPAGLPHWDLSSMRLIAYQLFFNSPSPLLSCSRPQCPGTARLSSGAWYCWEPVSHTEEHWDGFRLDLRAFPQVLIAWQRGVDCFFLPGSNGINNVVSHRYLLHIHTCSNPSASLVARSSNETSEPMKTTVVWSGF